MRGEAVGDARESGALAHARQAPVALTAAAILHLVGHADAVVPHEKREARVVVPERDLDALGLRVLERVEDRFARDQAEGFRQRRRQGPGRAFHTQRERGAVRVRELAPETFQRVLDALGVRRRQAQVGDAVAAFDE